MPSRSLLSRITDHHLQIIANQAPIGFEAEFVNQRGAAVMYRGILLPFSSDDDTIDFIFGVINWKELADQQTTDDLLLEIDQALKASPAAPPLEGPLTAWADGPAESRGPSSSETGAAETDTDDAWPAIPARMDEPEPEPELEADAPSLTFGRRRRGLIASPAEDDWAHVPLAEGAIEPAPAPAASLAPVPQPYEQSDPEPQGSAPMDFDDFDPAAFGISVEPAAFDEHPPHAGTDEDSDTLDLSAFAALDDFVHDGFDTAPDVPFGHASASTSDDGMALADWLASARELAHAAQESDHRSRQSLYAAIGRAYDFSLAAAADPDGFAELVADAGLTIQDRAPMTPLVKLVFGANYDKTRLTEYAAVLSHAARLGLECGTLDSWLLQAPGGLKAVVQAERQLRREDSGTPKAEKRSPRERLARKLRKLETRPLSAVDTEGSEFTLLVARRLGDGSVVLLGEVADDAMLLERAARRLVA